MNLVLTRGREGVQNSKNLEDVICTCPLLAADTAFEVRPLVKMLSRRLISQFAQNGIQIRNFSGNAKDAKIGIIGMGGVGKFFYRQSKLAIGCLSLAHSGTIYAT